MHVTHHFVSLLTLGMRLSALIDGNGLKVGLIMVD